MTFNPSSDLNAIQKLIVSDAKIRQLMDLSGPTMASRVGKYIGEDPDTPPEVAEAIIISESIIKRSQWDGLATDEKRLCIYFVPDRRTRNESFLESTIQIDVHVPATQDFKAWEIQEYVKKLLHKEKINKRYTYFNGQLGELPTMQDFFCCGSRFNFSRLI